MSALAPRAAPVFGATMGSERALLKRPGGVVAAAPAAFGEMARENFASRIVATRHSAPAQKGVRSGVDAKILAERMEKELDAVRGLLKEAVLLSRGAGRSGVSPACTDGERIVAAKRGPEAPSAVDAAAKRRKTSPSKPAPEAAHQRTRTEREKQTLPDQQRTAPTTMQRPMNKLIDEAKVVLERRRLEEIARAREKFRRELLEVEKAAMPDETIYPEDLEELGLTAFQYAVTPTKRQAQRRSG